MSGGLALSLPSKPQELLRASAFDWKVDFAARGKAAARSGANEAEADHRAAVAVRGSFAAEFFPVIPLRPLLPGSLPSPLAAPARKLESGLSNDAYLHACAGTRFLEVTLKPARVKFTFFDPINLKLSPADVLGGKRGVIREMSPSSRDRLADRAATLDAEGQVPQCMVTLTSPANWHQIYVADADGVVIEGGRVFKEHLRLYRARLERFMDRMGIPSWSALWFLEFQKRGAPHAHLMLFGCTIPEPVRRALRGWTARAWNDIVGNPSERERLKHLKAGTQVAKMKCKHFGYAKKYAAKADQKEVPDEFSRVGRFWGCWNYRAARPTVLNFDFSLLNPEDHALYLDLVTVVLETVRQYSPAFVDTRLARVNRALDGPFFGKFGFTVFGAAASDAFNAYRF